MRKDFRIQAGINWLRLVHKKDGYWKKWLWRYGWQWIRPMSRKKLNSNIFDIEEIARYRRYAIQMGKFDKNWFIRMFEPETKGVRVWEYGKLFERLEGENIKEMRILDVGSGGSRLPDYLANLEAKEVVSLDLKKQMEKRTKKLHKKVKYVTGDMTKMKFADNYFDLVISVSAIEHCGTKKSLVSNSKKAIKEGLRVTKKDGLFLITTDVCLNKQKSDNWPLWSADWPGVYSKKEFEIVFGKWINWKKEKEKLKHNQRYANYRGRWFTTVAIIIKKAV